MRPQSEQQLRDGSLALRGSRARVLLWACAHALVCALFNAAVHYHSTDIRFADESLYLGGGLHFASGGRPDGENAPLYALLYWLESLLVADPVMLYYVNWGLVLLAVLLGVVLFAWTVGVGLAGTLALTAGVSVLGAFRVWPYVAIPAGACVLLAATLILRGTSPARAWARASVMLWLGAFFRPELALAAALCLAAAAWQARARESRGHSEWRPVAAAAIVACALMALFGRPFGAGRSLFALGQHYAVNIATSRNLALDAWLDWEKLFRADFARATSVAEALLINPRAFVWHVGRNLRQIWRCAYLVTLHFPSPLAIKLGAGLTSTALIIFGARSGLLACRENPRLRRLLLLVVFAATPTVLSMLVIHPRVHYLLPPLMGVIAFAIAGGRHAYAAQPWLTRSAPLTAAGASLVMMGVGLVALRLSRAQTFPNRTFAAATARYEWPARPLRVLEASIASFVFTRNPYVYIDVTGCNPFLTCLQDRQLDVIIVEGRLEAYFKRDDGLASFRRDPERFGYRVIPVTGTDVLLYAHRDLSIGHD